ncbi:MAG: hypothetical protein P1V20_24290, partial [Verrucomicrobiales bacterium]|nr:hypothetical protein [Verrucomicrobiales bacterium]
YCGDLEITTTEKSVNRFTFSEDFGESLAKLDTGVTPVLRFRKPIVVKCRLSTFRPDRIPSR